MPIYEYRCEDCGHELDAIQKVSDAPLTDCPACGASALKKLVSAPSFRLKGSGWYETDFKKDNRRNLHDGGGKGDGKAADGDKQAAKDGAGKSSGSDAKTGTESAGKKASGSGDGKAASGKKTSSG